VPAAMLLFTRGVGFFFAASVACALMPGEADGVRGELKGCASELDVAGGMDVDWRVASRRREDVVRKRVGCVWVREAARRHVRQIIFGVVGGEQLRR
jgi:hypothetical protein